MSWTVIGHESAIETLSRSIKSGRVSHAYLFAGPKHVGKTLTALQLAQSLNCMNTDDPPCGRCRQCDRIAAGAHADVEVVTVGGLCDEPEHNHARDNSRQIRICQVRRIERLVSRAPFEGSHRVLIIEPADALGREAVGALLKTLEEPPANVVFILITDREEMLEPTVVSRTRRVAFVGLPRAEIERALRTRWDQEPSRAAELARAAGGRLGAAVIALHDERIGDRRRQSLDQAEALAGASLSERFTVAGDLGGGFTRDRAGLHDTLAAWQDWWRDLLLVAAGRYDDVAERGRLDTLRALAPQCGVAGAVRALQAITDARQALDENASPVLALEAMMLALPRVEPNAVSSRLTTAQE